ncbi:VTC domain-containing protein [Yoonia rosea]|uniref:VTC domain-containing protein n=1 Tax=Yoonia rosea TaxID=287098 RepID=A0A1R3X1H9_9RHOB|nr:polyphosphate polymerase domain-containing protein [Yoonia rosea]SIT84035.1 VTC domain-containing protein [Yoonia rosea]
MNDLSNIDQFTASFSPVSLEDLNAKAEMMARIDNKYVVQSDDLLSLVPDLSEAFDILEIKQQRAFTYDTRYFDDAERSAYYEHHQGKRRGFKVRVRNYVDAGLCFLEVKVKGQRGMTEKYRMPYDLAQLAQLTPDAAAFAQDTYGRQYDKAFDYALRPALDVRYQRMTLVARAGGERMTIDTDLCFQSQNRTFGSGTGVFIVETKSANGRGLADRLLRTKGERPTKRCSKYCIGMAATGQVTRYNRFLPTLRKLGLTVPTPQIGNWAQLCTDVRGRSFGPHTIAA